MPELNKKFPIRSGMRLAFFNARNFFSLKRHNFIVAVCNAILNNRNIKWSDNNSSIPGLVEIELGSAAATGQTYRLKSDEGDYFIAREWNGTDEGGVDIKIAKRPEARQPASEVIAGETFNYSYIAGPDALNDRRLVTGPVSETQTIVPYWLADGLIFARDVGYSGVVDIDGKPISLMDTSPRCWARISE